MNANSLTRSANERRVLTLLRIEGQMTRAAMARRLSLTPATLTNIVEALGQRDLVVELQAGGQRAERVLGRPGVDVALNPRAAYFLGVEVGVGTIRFALLNLAMNVAAEQSQRASPDVSPEQAVSMIAAFASSLREQPAYRDRMQAAILTVPGLIRCDGFVVHTPILGWRDANVQPMAQQALGLPTTVENDANAAAFGELYSRPAAERDCVVYLKLGTGCGGGIIVDGRLLRGAFGTASEFGHLRIRDSGPRCSCGQRGCIEPNVTLGALARLVEANPADADLAALPKRVAQAALRGDPVADHAVAIIADHLALGLATLVNIFNPRTVLLGGPMRPVLKAAIPILEREIAARVVPGMTVPNIELSRLGDMECAIGAATIAHHRAVDISHLQTAH